MTPSYFVSLGVLTFAVKTYPAARDVKMPLVNLHKPCAEAGLAARLAAGNSSCTACHKPIEDRSQVVKGYEAVKNQYVLVDPAELEALEASSDKTMTIRAFVPWDAVDPVILEKSYHVGPADPAAAKAFALLRAAMAHTQRAAVVQYVQSHREKVGILRVMPEGMMFHEAFYAHEVRAYREQKWADAPIDKRELDLAVQLVKAHEEAFDLSLYVDQHQGRMNELIQAKLAGRPTPTLATPKPVGTVVNLMDALEASLAAKAGKTKPGKAVAAKKPARKTA